MVGSLHYVQLGKGKASLVALLREMAMIAYCAGGKRRDLYRWAGWRIFCAKAAQLAFTRRSAHAAEESKRVQSGGNFELGLHNIS